MQSPVLVCPAAFKGSLRATEVASAIGRGLERAGLAPPDLCPIAGGGEGTLEVLLTALGGSTAAASVTDPLGHPIQAGFAVLEDGAVAIVEAAETGGVRRTGEAQRDPSQTVSSRGTGELIAAAAGTGVAVVLVAAGGSAITDGGAGAVEALREAGGPRGAQIVVLCDERTPYEQGAARVRSEDHVGATSVRALERRLAALAATLPKDPRGVAMSGAGGGLAGALWSAFGAVLEHGASFVLGELGFDTRMRTARVVVVGEGRLDARTLAGKATGEIATRARQAGVPAHAIVGEDRLDLFGKRILDLQVVLEAGTREELEAAGERLGGMLARLEA
jgi:glycerate kinase